MPNYSPDLIAKVKKLYPSNTDMHRMAEQGTYFLGRYLDDSSSSGIPLSAILTATSLEELQYRAREMQQKVDLYIQWGKETRDQ